MEGGLLVMGEKFTEVDILEAIEIAKENMDCFATNLLQRKMHISWNKALEIIDELQKRGYVGKWEHLKPRKVFLEKFSSERRSFDTACRNEADNSYSIVVYSKGLYYGGVGMSNKNGRPLIDLSKEKAISVWYQSDSLRHAVQILEGMGFSVSKDTLRRRLKEWGVKTRRIQKWIIEN